MKEQVERICISVNTECNLGCKYCYFFNPENRILKESVLSVDEIFTILKNINEYSKNNYVKKAIKVNFVGSGEPLINWDIIKYNVLLCQDHLTKHSYFTHYATNRNS